MVNKIGLSNFLELFEYFGKTEMYHLYRLSNSFFFPVGLKFKQDAIKFKLFKLSLDGLRGNHLHWVRLEKRRGADSLHI